MNEGYLLVLLVLWLDPGQPPRPLEARYEVRVVGHYNTRDRCEKRRIEYMDCGKGRCLHSGRMLWSECRKASD